MKQNNSTNLIAQMLNSIATALPVSLAFLIPLFFLPITLEFYSFNKLALITISTLLLIVIWVIKIVSGEYTHLVKSKIDLPLWLFTIVVILSTVFSIDKTSSLYGTQGRWLGLVTLLILISYYYLSTPLLETKKSIKTAIYAFLTSGTISTFIALLSYYGFYLGGASFLRSPTFSPSGTALGAVFLAGLAATAALTLICNEKNQKLKIVLIAGFAINFLYIALTGTFLGWTLIISGILGSLLIFDRETITKSKSSIIATAIVFAVITTLVVVPATGKIIKSDLYPQQPRLPAQESWRVSTSIIQDFPLLATGPGTFDLNYPAYKPLSINDTQWWNLRFDVPYSEVFNIMATLGLIGIAVAAYFAFRSYKIIYENAKIQDETGLIKIVSVMLIPTLISFVFMPANILSSFTLFLILSLSASANICVNKKQKFDEAVSIGISSLKSGDPDQIITQEYYKYIISVVMLGIATYTGYVGYKIYLGEYYMRQSAEAALNNDGNMTYEYQRRAININPKRDLYHNTYAQTNLALANSLAAGENLTDTDRQTIQTLIAQAIRTSRVSTEVVTPRSPANWETRAVIYRSIINIAENAADWTLGAYNTAIQLDPANPRLRLELGGVLYSQGDYLSAANQFRQATALKPDYANAYFNFAQALIELDDLSNAKRALEITKTLLDSDSEDYAKVEGQLAIINENLEQVAGATTERPTVEEIAGIETTTENQEPLTNAAEQQQIENENLDVGALPAPAEEIPQEEVPEEEAPVEETSEEETTEEEAE